jgi:AhpD family alkylhydroperoxidase
MSTATTAPTESGPRFQYAHASPEPFKAMLALEGVIRKGGLEGPLLNLVKLRASQVNGCAYCIDMHWKDARAAGETEIRLYSLDAWRESPFYSPRERAALAWAESLTSIAATHAPDEVFAAVRAEFKDKELADLSWAIAAINAWNRIAIGFRATPGQYTPASH